MANLNGSGSDTESTVPAGFRYRRATPTLGGYRPAVDDVVHAELARLDELLRKKVVLAGDEKALKAIVSLPLTPRRAGTTDKVGVGQWANGSLCDKLRNLKPGAGEDSIGEVATEKAPAADLRYEFADAIQQRQEELTLEQRTVLAVQGVRDLILARALLNHDISTVKSLFNFALHDDEGVPEVITYAVVSAAREYIHARQVRVPKIDEDDSEPVTRLGKASLSFSADTFQARVVEIAADAVSNSRYEDLIAEAKIADADLPAHVRPRLIQYIKSSPVKVTKDNAPFMVPFYLVQATSAAAATVSGTSTTVDAAAADDPFKVSFFVEDVDTLQISTAAVKCASQLYYVMTLGDELGVFDAVRHFTHRYLFRQGFAVEDQVLRRDLENYVFSEQFPGLDTVDGSMRMMRCTREGERRSFYRQVFDRGQEPIPGDAPANSDFGRLWKILVLESARYLERVQSSPHPVYVSPQNVMQAVEDLQYNLSTSCVGMATVMTPLMYAELDFVINRILGHPEVRKHLVPAGGSWWKVVERLAADRNQRVRASVLYNKARLGYTLIRDIADYSVARFEQEATFNAFISNVEAFITTQSIIQEEIGEEDEERDDSGGTGWGAAPGMPGMPAIPGMPAGIPGMPPWSPTGSGDGGYGRETVPATGGSSGNGNGHGSPPSGGDEWDF